MADTTTGCWQTSPYARDGGFGRTDIYGNSEFLSCGKNALYWGQGNPSPTDKGTNLDGTYRRDYSGGGSFPVSFPARRDGASRYLNERPCPEYLLAMQKKSVTPGVTSYLDKFDGVSTPAERVAKRVAERLSQGLWDNNPLQIEISADESRIAEVLVKRVAQRLADPERRTFKKSGEPICEVMLSRAASVLAEHLRGGEAGMSANEKAFVNRLADCLTESHSENGLAMRAFKHIAKGIVSRVAPSEEDKKVISQTSKDLVKSLAKSGGFRAPRKRVLSGWREVLAPGPKQGVGSCIVANPSAYLSAKPASKAPSPTLAPAKAPSKASPPTPAVNRPAPKAVSPTPVANKPAPPVVNSPSSKPSSEPFNYFSLWAANKPAPSVVTSPSSKPSSDSFDYFSLLAANKPAPSLVTSPSSTARPARSSWTKSEASLQKVFRF